MSELFVCVVKVQAQALVILLYWEKESVCHILMQPDLILWIALDG